MDSFSKFKEWVNEHVPMLAVVYENKYVGMAYDRFASLPPKQQRQVMIGVGLGIVAIITGFILSSYLSLWTYSGRADKYYQRIYECGPGSGRVPLSDRRGRVMEFNRPKISTIFICIGLFLFFLLICFPYQNLKGYIFGRIFKETGITVVADDIYPSFFGW